MSHHHPRRHLPPPPPQSPAALISDLRSCLQITRETLATYLLVSESLVAKWEAGCSIPQGESLTRLATIADLCDRPDILECFRSIQRGERDLVHHVLDLSRRTRKAEAGRECEETMAKLYRLCSVLESPRCTADDRYATAQAMRQYLDALEAAIWSSPVAEEAAAGAYQAHRTA